MRCGTTLIFDHHASLSSVGGSLDRIEQGLTEVGLRGCLCYEVTDRGGKGQRDITLEENERYLQKLRDRPAGGVPRFRGLVGAHASFTLEDRTLQLLEGICSRQGAGLHIHLAEGTTDREVSRDRGWRDPLQRLLDNGLVRPGSVFAHGVDLSPLDMQTLEENGVWLVHCGRSNMNNGVGRAAGRPLPRAQRHRHRRPGRQHVGRAAHDLLPRQRGRPRAAGPRRRRALLAGQLPPGPRDLRRAVRQPRTRRAGRFHHPATTSRRRP